MRVDTSRFIDRYVGTPICFLVDMFLKVGKIFTKKKSKNTPKNVLFIELSEMGSTILANPAIEKTKNRAEVFFVIFKKNVNALFILNTIKKENIFTIREDNLKVLLIDTMSFLIWCRKKKIDSIVDLEMFSRYTSLLSIFSGAKNLVGFYPFHNEGLYRGNFLTKKVTYNPHIHISKNFLSLVYALFLEKDNLPFSKINIKDSEITCKKVSVSDNKKEYIYKKISDICDIFNAKKQKIILLNSNSSKMIPQRKWPTDNYVLLAKKIVKQAENVVILLTGSKEEREEIEQISCRVASKRCINFANEVEFLDLPALYSISSIMLTNDSGPAHFSCVSNMVTFVLFGPETPLLYKPLSPLSKAIYANLACSPCVSAFNHRKTTCKDNMCLKSISVDSIYEKIFPYL